MWFLLCRYGDKTARTVPGRIFAVIWVLMGLVIGGLLIGSIASAFTSSTSSPEDQVKMLYGANVSACRYTIKLLYTFYKFCCSIIWSILVPYLLPHNILTCLLRLHTIRPYHLNFASVNFSLKPTTPDILITSL